jgi:CarD family transcriptional regulator
MYQVGDKIVYPMHGAGIIETIEEKEVFGKKQAYYILKMPIGDLSIMIPTDTECSNGLRHIHTDIKLEDFLNYFSHIEVCEELNWNKRYRENLIKMRSGDLYEIAKVVKGLLLREKIKPLSTGEKKMLTCARQILFSELILSLNITTELLENGINEALVQ